MIKDYLTGKERPEFGSVITTIFMLLWMSLALTVFLNGVALFFDIPSLFTPLNLNDYRKP